MRLSDTAAVKPARFGTTLLKDQNRPALIGGPVAAEPKVHLAGMAVDASNPRMMQSISGLQQTCPLHA